MSASLTGSLVGRSAERAASIRFVEALADGPAALLIEGEAGIGKTMLWRAVATAAVERGHLVVSATAVDDETDLPFVALRDLFDGVAAPAENLPPVQRDAWDTALLRSTQPVAAADHHAVSAAVLGVVRALAAQRPLVVAVDDVTWMDQASERVLRYVVRRLTVEPVGILAARRAAPSTYSDVPLALDGPSLAHRLQLVELGPLDTEALHALLAAQGGPPLPRRTTRQIHQMCGGNPFHAAEIARVVRRRGPAALDEGTLPLPHRLMESTAERLAALTPAARQVLTTVAEASAATSTLVSDVLGVDSVDGLADAVADGMLEVDGVNLRFTHPLLRSAVAATTPDADRRAVHRRLAQIVVDRDERAAHLAASASGPDESIALAVEQAAERAFRRGAPDAAAALARRSVALTPAGTRSASARRKIGQAEYEYRSENLPTAAARLSEVIAELPPGNQRAEALLWLSTVSQDQNRSTQARQYALSSIDEATDEDVRSAAQRQLARSLLRAGDAATACQYAAKSLDTASAISDPAAVAESQGTLGWTQFWTGQGIDTDLLVGARGHRWTRFAPHDARACVLAARMLTWSDQHEHARAVLEPEINTAREEGLDRALALLLSNLAEVDCHQGRWDEALRHAAEGMRAAELTDSNFARSWLFYARGLVAAHQGRLEDARTDAAQGRSIGDADGFVWIERFHRSLLGFVELSAGDPAAARQQLEPLARSSPPVFEPALMRYVPDLAEALVALGELHDADALLGPFETHAIRLDRPWALVTGTRARALLAAARGDIDAAIRAAAAALAACARLSMPFEHARTMLAAGTVQRRARRRREARETLSAAVAEFDRLGSHTWSERARDELRRIAGRTPNPTTLTEAERRIVDLVIAGQTNREVAAALFLALSTVEAALWKIYRKLGVRSRTELAAHMATHNERLTP